MPVDPRTGRFIEDDNGGGNTSDPGGGASGYGNGGGGYGGNAGNNNGQGSGSAQFPGGGATYGGNGGGNGGGGGQQQSNASVNSKGFSLGGLSLGTNGHIYGEKRTYLPDGSYGYETVDLGPESDLAAISAASGIPQEALGYTLQSLHAQQGQTQRSLVQLGNYTVEGINGDGTWTLRDGYGNLITKQESELLSLPGVSETAIRNARNDYIQQTRIATQSQTWTAARQTNPDGTLTLTDYYGNTKNVSPAEAMSGQYKGVEAGAVQQAVLNGNDSNWQAGQVTQYGLPNPGQQSQGGQMATQSSGLPLPYAANRTDAGDAGGTQATAQGRTSDTQPVAGAGTMPDASGAHSGLPAVTGQGGGTGYQSGATGQSYNQTGNANPYAQFGSGYTGGANLTGQGMTNQGYGQQLTGLQRLYDTVQTDYNLKHQGEQNLNTSYKVNTQLNEANNGSRDRNLAGFGFAGIGPARLAGQ